MADLPNWFSKQYLPVNSLEGKLQWLWAVDQKISDEEAVELRRFIQKEIKLPDEDVRIDTEELVPIPWLTRLFVWLRWLPREES